MSSNVIQFGRQTYVAKLTHLALGAPTRATFSMAGTLDGYVDFAIAGKQGEFLGTYQLSCDEARQLIAALNSVVTDIQTNCLYDRDPLLLPE